jgi:hypothetical protein
MVAPPTLGEGPHRSGVVGRVETTGSVLLVRKRVEGGIPDLVYDLLATDGGWLTTEGIQLALPDRNPASVARALERMHAAGDLKRRKRLLNRPYRNPSRWTAALGSDTYRVDEWSA